MDPILSKKKWIPSFNSRLQKSLSFDGPNNERFIVLDNVMMEAPNQNIDDDHDYIDGVKDNGLDYCDSLRKELDMFLKKSKPGLTKGDNNYSNHKLEFFPRNHQDQDQETRRYVRGDYSIFIARAYRDHESFPLKHPYLYRLIATITNTFKREFSSSSAASHQQRISLDFPNTSVQVAVYPGDGKSGYLRHCDRHNSCREESSSLSLSSSPPSSNRSERIITAIYYVTNNDWDEILDGGALRLYSNSSSIDVCPYQDRMVVFRSDVLEHQVMASLRRPRLAVTLWFYGTVDNCSSMNQPKGTKIVSHSSYQNNLLPANVSDPLPISILNPTIYAGSLAEKSDSTIFVSVASYRDSETRSTIDALFSTALNPTRIFVGVVLQLEDDNKYDENIWSSILEASSDRNDRDSAAWKPRSFQIRCMRIHSKDATGPCYARGLCQTLYRDEDFVMQIDSHMRFRNHWDEYLIQTILGIQRYRSKEKIVLTAYPIGYSLPNNIPNETRGTYLVPWKFDENGILRQRGRLLKSVAENQQEKTALDSSNIVFPVAVTHARRQYLFAGGFNFGFSQFFKDVPYDTMGMHHLFFGEELTMAVRLFTNGYDLFAPNETVCYHLWSRAHRPTSTTVAASIIRKKNVLQQKSRETVLKQLQGDQSMIGIGNLGLGKERRADDFAENLGVDFSCRRFTRKVEKVENGELTDNDFVSKDNRRSIYAENSLESRISSLDVRTKDMIGKFLSGIKF